MTTELKPETSGSLKAYSMLLSQKARAIPDIVGVNGTPNKKPMKATNTASPGHGTLQSFSHHPQPGSSVPTDVSFSLSTHAQVIQVDAKI